MLINHLEYDDGTHAKNGIDSWVSPDGKTTQ